MATLRVSSGDGSSAAAVDAFLRAAAFVLPDPLPMPRCLYSPLDPRASDSQLYQRLRRFVASPLYQRLRRFVASPLYQRLRRFVASSLRRFVASSLHCICGSVGYVVFCFSCSGCQCLRGFRDVLQLSIISVAWVSRSGGSVVFEVSRSGGQVGV
jgi:hypothetical protein